MIIAYFDCFSGICGDMILGAFLDLGMDTEYFIEEIKKIDISGYEIKVKNIEINHIVSTDVSIVVKEEQPPRNLADINRLIDRSDLSRDVKTESKQVFLKLAEVESKIHNTEIKRIHFHEIGGVDSIIDVVGAVIGRKKLQIDKIFCSPLPLGKGFVNCSHGMIPIPAPATVELLKNVPVYQTERVQELVTPTGAAIITTFTDYFGAMPPMKIKKIGYGAGKTKSEYPNLLRVFLGERYKK